MFCPKCGKELREYERSCPYCGAAAAHGRGNRHRIKPMELIAIAAGVLALIVACTVLVYQIAQRKKEAQWKELTVDRREAAAVNLRNCGRANGSTGTPAAASRLSTVSSVHRASFFRCAI